MRRVLLHEIAHGRTGDKGNRLNVSVVAYHRELWPIVLEQVTAARVHALFRHRGATGAVRYELPQLMALNFVVDAVLEGGGERQPQPRYPRKNAFIPRAWARG